MKKIAKSFVHFREMLKFADASIGHVGQNALLTILQDRLTSFDLVKSGKFKIGVKTSLVKLVLYPLRRTRTAYYICDTRYFPEPY